jgi:hypothetical protein
MSADMYRDICVPDGIWQTGGHPMVRERDHGRIQARTNVRDPVTMVWCATRARGPVESSSGR